MKLTKYILTSAKLEGSLILTYADGFIKSLINEFKGLTEKQWDALVQELPAEEINISHLEEIGLKLKQDKANNKVAMFCDAYKAKMGVSYKASAMQGAQLRDKEVNTELLKCYFSSANFIFRNKSIGNYAKYYNELRAECYGQLQDAPVKSQHPNQYNRKYEQSLNGPALTDYWKHLRDLGYTPVKSERDGSILDWIKQKPQPAVDEQNKSKTQAAGS